MTIGHEDELAGLRVVGRFVANTLHAMATTMIESGAPALRPPVRVLPPN